MRLLKRIYADFQEDHKRVFIYFSIIFIGITVFVFRNYLTGQNLFVFLSDIGSDSGYQSYPNFVYLARQISLGNWSEGWNNAQSLGGVKELTIPTLNNWVCFFGTERVAYLLGISQFLKVLLAGYFFYFYLRIMKVSRGISSAFALCYAYCAHMILRCSWQSYPNEVVLVALWLLCFELFYSKQIYMWLPLASGIFFLNMSGYYTVLYTAVFFAYGILRYYSEHKVNVALIKGEAREHALFFGSILIGLLISAVTTLPSLISMLSSSRFENNSLSMNFSLSFTDWITLKVAYLKTIGMNILDVESRVGNTNLLEGPAFYCGLMTLVFVPIAITLVKRRKKIWFLIGVLAAFLYILVWPLRQIVNGFSNATFKLSSFWIIVLLFLIAAQGAQALKKKKIGTVKIIVTIAICIVFAILCYMEEANSVQFGISIGIMLFYGVLLWLNNRKLSHSAFCMILLICCATEVCWMAYGNVNDRGIITNEEITQHQYYNDDTMEAVDYLNENDSTFYRVGRDYRSVFLCDSLYQGYNGTEGYIGGGGDRNLTGEFYESLGFPMYSQNHYSLGFMQSTSINTLMNVKYIFSKSAFAGNYGYTKIDEEDSITLFENQYALSLGVFYQKYILREDFEQLTIAQKRNVIMKAIVLESEEEAEETSLEEIAKDDLQDTLEGLENSENYKVEYTQERFENTLRISFDAIEGDEVVVVKMALDNQDEVSYVGSGNTATGDKVDYGTDTSSYQFHSCFVQDENEYIYEFCAEGTNWISFTITDDMEVDGLDVYIIPQEIYYEEYRSEISELSEYSMDLEKWSDSEYNGSFTLDENRTIFFSIPYDENWHLYIDGEEADIIQANIGFMGVSVSKGEHEIRLVYQANNKYCILSVCGCILYLLYLSGCIRNQRKKKIVKNQ